MKPLYIATCEDELTAGRDLQQWASNIKEQYGINDYTVDEIIDEMQEAWENGNGYGVVMAEGDVPVRLYKLSEI